MSDQAQSLVEGLLVVDPSKRYTPQQVLDHPWIKNPEARNLNLINLDGYRKNMKLTQAMYKVQKVFVAQFRNI